MSDDRIFKNVEFQTQTPGEAEFEASDDYAEFGGEPLVGESETAKRIAEAGEFCGKMVGELADYADALTATAEETACARFIRDELSPLADTRMESFKTSPHAGRMCSVLLALVYFIALFCYLISFAGGDAFGIAMVVVALIVLGGGGFVAGAMFLGNGKFVKILPKKVSYNVFSESRPQSEQHGNKLLVIASNHDAVAGAYTPNFDTVRKVVFIVVPASVVLFLFFCAIKLGVGSNDVTKVTLLTVFPLLTSLTGIIALALHFSPLQKHARENNNAGTAVAMALYEYLLKHPEVLPEDTRVCFVSFGGENAAHGGSRAFAEAHPEVNGATAIVIGDVLSSDFSLIRKDALRNIVLSQISPPAALAAADKNNVACELADNDIFKSKLNSLHGFSASALAEAGCDCAMFVAKDYTEKGRELNNEDMGRLFVLSLGTAVTMTEEKYGKRQ